MTALATEDRIARVVADVVARASRVIEVDRVWLFGSQARGTAKPDSDVDIAFQIPPSARARWSEFVLACEDEVPALVDLDLVDLDSCDPSLAREVVVTGRVVYERAR
jgi:predicted nucleotidyltransferase